MIKKLSKLDKELIKLKYGSIKNYNKLKKDNKKEREKLQEEQWKRDESIALAQIRERKENDIKLLKDRKEFIQEAEKFKKYILKQYNNYTSFLIAYDICNCDYFNIEIAIIKTKYNIDTVKEIYNIACNMCSKLRFNIECLTIPNKLIILP